MSKKGETLVAVLTLACSFVVAQPVHRSDEVMGLSGTVRVLPNPSATHTTIVFNSNTPLNATSSQIVFVLQADGPALPPAWSGKARLLTGDGFVAVVPDEETDQKWLLKFRDREVPAALAKQGFQVYGTIGIARYGEKTPLTDEEIKSLAETGRNCTPSAKVKVGEF